MTMRWEILLGLVVVYGVGVAVAVSSSRHILVALLWPVTAADWFQRNFPR